MNATASKPTVTLTPNPPGGASASALLQALRQAGVTHVVTVPDFVQVSLHDRLIQADCGIAHVYACSEDQALTTATGLYVGGAKPAVLVQNQGFYKCLNTLRATCIDAGVPIVFLVGQFGRELENIGQPTRQSRRSMVRLMEPLLDTLGLRYWNLADDSDVSAVAHAFEHAHTQREGAVLLVDRYLTWN
jgi:sulfopyruvate decarboxylase TPP-binding subunit